MFDAVSRVLRVCASGLSIALGWRPQRIDPELEAWAQRIFKEQRHVPLVRPSRDLAERVLRRLQERDSGHH